MNMYNEMSTAGRLHACQYNVEERLVPMIVDLEQLYPCHRRIEYNIKSIGLIIRSITQNTSPNLHKFVEIDSPT